MALIRWHLLDAEVSDDHQPSVEDHIQFLGELEVEFRNAANSIGFEPTANKLVTIAMKVTTLANAGRAALVDSAKAVAWNSWIIKHAKPAVLNVYSDIGTVWAEHQATDSSLG